MDAHPSSPAPTVLPVVSVHQLTKTFGEGDMAVHAVSGIDLDIAAGEVVLVMGPSGSGKTTLLLMLGAMLRPTSGSVVIDGVDLATAPERRLPALRASHLGFIFQDFNLLSALTALENVELACNLAGLPGMSVPCGMSTDGLPIGAQLLGKPLDEVTVIRAGSAIEAAVGLGDRRPAGIGGI